MNERFMSYFDGELTIQNLYEGKIKGYVLDNMVNDEDMYQFEEGFSYCSYERILELMPAFDSLKYLYLESQSILERSSFNINNAVHKKDFLLSQGIYIRDEDADNYHEFIKKYAGFFEVMQKAKHSSVVRRIINEPQIFVHDGDIMVLGMISTTHQEVDELERQQFISQASVKRAQASLASAASNMIIAPGNKPMSVTASSLIGGTIGGATGAIIGAAAGIQKQNDYNRSVENYANTIIQYKNDVSNLISQASELEQNATALATHEHTYYYKAIALRTFFGLIPLLIPAYGVNIYENTEIYSIRKNEVTNYLLNGIYEEIDSSLIIGDEIRKNVIISAQEGKDRFFRESVIYGNNLKKLFSLMKVNGHVTCRDVSEQFDCFWNQASEVMSVLYCSGQINCQKSNNGTHFFVDKNITHFEYPEDEEWCMFYYPFMDVKIIHDVACFLQEKEEISFSDLVKMLSSDDVESEIYLQNGFAALDVIAARGAAKHIIKDNMDKWIYIDLFEGLESYGQLLEESEKLKNEIEDFEHIVHDSNEKTAKSIKNITLGNVDNSPLLTQKISELDQEIFDLRQAIHSSWSPLLFSKRKKLSEELLEKETLYRKYMNQKKETDKSKQEYLIEENNKIKAQLDLKYSALEDIKKQMNLLKPNFLREWT